MRRADPAKKRRIIDAAAALFAERHYHEVRMDDIAAAAGVAKGTLYQHFKDKDALYQGLIQDGIDRMVRQIEAALEGVIAPEERLLAQVRESVRFMERHGYVLELAQRTQALRTAPPCEPLSQTKARFLALVDANLRALPALERAPEGAIELASLAFGGMMREVLSFLPRPWRPDLAERMTALFLRGVLAAQIRPN